MLTSLILLIAEASRGMVVASLYAYILKVRGYVTNSIKSCGRHYSFLQLANDEAVTASEINSGMTPTVVMQPVDKLRRNSAGAVTAFSVGRLIAAPLFGAACDRLPFRTVFIILGAIAAAGHLLYVVADAQGGLPLLVAARFLVCDHQGRL